MNVSLPIKIFDERTILENFAFQHSLAPFFLEKAGREEFGIEKMKLVKIIIKIRQLLLLLLNYI
jgi:hypothetical protein